MIGDCTIRGYYSTAVACPHSICVGEREFFLLIQNDKMSLATQDYCIVKLTANYSKIQGKISSAVILKHWRSKQLQCLKINTVMLPFIATCS